MWADSIHRTIESDIVFWDVDIVFRGRRFADTLFNHEFQIKSKPHLKLKPQIM